MLFYLCLCLCVFSAHVTYSTPLNKRVDGPPIVYGPTQEDIDGLPQYEDVAEPRIVYLIKEVDCSTMEMIREGQWVNQFSAVVHDSAFIAAGSGEPAMKTSFSMHISMHWGRIMDILPVVQTYPASGNEYFLPQSKIIQCGRVEDGGLRLDRIVLPWFQTRRPNKYYFDPATGQGVLTKYWQAANPIGHDQSGGWHSPSSFLLTVFKKEAVRINIPGSEGEKWRYLNAVGLWERKVAMTHNSQRPIFTKYSKIVHMQDWRNLITGERQPGAPEDRVITWDVANPKEPIVEELTLARSQLPTAPAQTT
ncbi:MAG: hypothetical protein M1833_001597 [Piccolia ochrophora]|nr:MAG: hypothetical protein M1833_001597 [Piccolia ochrophora]